MSGRICLLALYALFLAPSITFLRLGCFVVAVSRPSVFEVYNGKNFQTQDITKIITGKTKCWCKRACLLKSECVGVSISRSIHHNGAEDVICNFAYQSITELTNDNGFNIYMRERGNFSSTNGDKDTLATSTSNVLSNVANSVATVLANDVTTDVTVTIAQASQSTAGQSSQVACSGDWTVVVVGVDCLQVFDDGGADNNYDQGKAKVDARTHCKENGGKIAVPSSPDDWFHYLKDDYEGVTLWVFGTYQGTNKGHMLGKDLPVPDDWWFSADEPSSRSKDYCLAGYVGSEHFGLVMKPCTAPYGVICQKAN